LEKKSVHPKNKKKINSRKNTHIKKKKMSNEAWYDIQIVEQENNGLRAVQNVASNVDADRLKFWVQEQNNISSETFDLFFQGVSLNANPKMTLRELGIVEGSEVIFHRLTNDELKAFDEVVKERRRIAAEENERECAAQEAAKRQNNNNDD
jgi:hypothetical protein